MKPQRKSSLAQKSSAHHKPAKKSIKKTNARRKIHTKASAAHPLILPSFLPTPIPPQSLAFRPSRPLFALGGGRSKSEPIKKRFETPDASKPKKELTQDDKDKKKLEKLQREKAKQATRQAQLSRSTERAKKEAELQTKKLANLQSLFQSAHLKVAEVDQKELAELQANEKRNQEEEEAAKAARALRRAQGTADV